MARLGWPEPGEWHFLDNDVVTVSKYKRRRGLEGAGADPVEYPWIVVEPPMLLRVWASPRTRQDSYEGVDHDAHPDGHEPTCGINCDGTVCAPPDRLDQPIFRDARYSCVEPAETWPDIQSACAVPKPRRPENRRRRK